MTTPADELAKMPEEHCYVDDYNALVKERPHTYDQRSKLIIVKADNDNNALRTFCQQQAATIGTLETALQKQVVELNERRHMIEMRDQTIEQLRGEVERLKAHALKYIDPMLGSDKLPKDAEDWLENRLARHGEGHHALTGIYPCHIMMLQNALKSQRFKLHTKDQLSARVKVLEAALDKLMRRMDLARGILTDYNPRPECNWGMLDTKLDREALKEPTK